MPSPMEKAAEAVRDAVAGSPEYHAELAVTTFLKAAAEDNHLTRVAARAGFPGEGHLDKAARVNLILRALAQEAERG